MVERKWNRHGSLASLLETRAQKLQIDRCGDQFGYWWSRKPSSMLKSCLDVNMTHPKLSYGWSVGGCKFSHPKTENKGHMKPMAFEQFGLKVFNLLRENKICAQNQADGESHTKVIVKRQNSQVCLINGLNMSREILEFLSKGLQMNASRH
jgi:hypothetical protein